MRTQTASQTVGDFLSQLGAGTPAPGGGAAVAVAGGLGAALVGMAAGLTVGRPKYHEAHEEMLALQKQMDDLAEAFCASADADQDAFSQVMAGFQMPKGTKAEKAARQEAVTAGLKRAVEAPLATMKHAVTVMRGALAAVRRANPNAVPDAYVGYRLAEAAFEGAALTVAINAEALKDDEFRTDTLAELKRLLGDRQELQQAFQVVPDPLARLGLR